MDAEGRLTAVELFAGAGGLLLGTSLAGFRHLAAAEWEHNCCETLRLNQRTSRITILTKTRNPRLHRLLWWRII